MRYPLDANTPTHTYDIFYFQLTMCNFYYFAHWFNVRFSFLSFSFLRISRNDLTQSNNNNKNRQKRIGPKTFCPNNYEWISFWKYIYEQHNILCSLSLSLFSSCACIFIGTMRRRIWIEIISTVK